MAKFTKGPWRVSEYGDSIECDHDITYNWQGYKLFEVCKLNDNEYILYRDEAVQKANAALIAAAPDLYEWGLKILELFVLGKRDLNSAEKQERDQLLIAICKVDGACGL